MSSYNTVTKENNVLNTKIGKKKTFIFIRLTSTTYKKWCSKVVEDIDEKASPSFPVISIHHTAKNKLLMPLNAHQNYFSINIRLWLPITNSFCEI